MITIRDIKRMIDETIVAQVIICRLLDHPYPDMMCMMCDLAYEHLYFGGV